MHITETEGGCVTEALYFGNSSNTVHFLSTVVHDINRDSIGVKETCMYRESRLQQRTHTVTECPESPV